MNSATELVNRFAEIADLLRPVLPPDAAAEAPAIFFFLKSVTGTAPPRSREDRLAALTWEQLAEHATPETALLELMGSVESLTSEFEELSKQSHLARNLSGRTDLRPHLRRVCAHVAQIEISGLQPVDSAQIFQDLLQRFHERVMRPTTPPELARFVVRLVGSKDAKSVFDPSCGSAEFLSAAATFLPANRALVLEGEESQQSTALLARIALWLGGWRAHVHVPDADGGRDSRDVGHRTFDIVLANPPFGQRMEGPALFAHEGNRSTKLSSEVAFVDRIDHALAPKGRAAVLVPTGLLSRHGSDYYLRKDLLARDRLEAVVMLPGNLFAHTKVYVALLVLRADKEPTRKGKVLFVDLADRDGKSSLDDQIGAEIRRVISGGAIKSTAMRLVEHAEIVANDFELAVWRYLTRKKSPTTAISFPVALAAFQQAIDHRNATEREALSDISTAHEVLKRHSAGQGGAP